MVFLSWFFFCQAEDGIRDLVRSRGLGDVYKRQGLGGLDVLYMTRVQGERFDNPADYERVKGSHVLTADVMGGAPEGMVVLHPLPRVDEISTGVDDDPRAKYFEQAAGGVPVRMALISLLLGMAEQPEPKGSFRFGGTVPTPGELNPADEAMLAFTAETFNAAARNIEAVHLRDGLRESGMLMMIIGTSILFGYMMSSLQVTQSVAQAIGEMQVNRWLVMAAINLLLLVAGMFLPPAAIILMTTPILMPVINAVFTAVSHQPDEEGPRPGDRTFRRTASAQTARVAQKRVSTGCRVAITRCRIPAQSRPDLPPAGAAPRRAPRISQGPPVLPGHPEAHWLLHPPHRS